MCFSCSCLAKNSLSNLCLCSASLPAEHLPGNSSTAGLGALGGQRPGGTAGLGKPLGRTRAAVLPPQKHSSCVWLGLSKTLLNPVHSGSKPGLQNLLFFFCLFLNVKSRARLPPYTLHEY